MRICHTLQSGPVEGYQFGYSPTQLIRPFPVWCYFIDGLLIDTAQRHCQREVLAAFEGKRIHQIVLTHYHEDHAGNATALARQHNCPVKAGALTLERVAHSYPILPYEQFWFGRIDACPGPAIPGLPGVITERLPSLLETARYQFQPILTLGHSDDHYVLLAINEGWLFAGDFYVGKLKIFRRNENIYEMIESTRHILTYDFESVFCGHNPVLKRGKEAVAAKLQYLEDIVGQIQHVAQRGLSIPRLVREVGLQEQWWAKLMTFNDVGADYIIRSVLYDNPLPAP